MRALFLSRRRDRPHRSRGRLPSCTDSSAPLGGDLGCVGRRNREIDRWTEPSNGWRELGLPARAQARRTRSCDARVGTATALVAHAGGAGGADVDECNGRATGLADPRLSHGSHGVTRRRDDPRRELRNSGTSALPASRLVGERPRRLSGRPSIWCTELTQACPHHADRRVASAGKGHPDEPRPSHGHRPPNAWPRRAAASADSGRGDSTLLCVTPSPGVMARRSITGRTCTRVAGGVAMVYACLSGRAISRVAKLTRPFDPLTGGTSTQVDGPCRQPSVGPRGDWRVG